MHKDIFGQSLSEMIVSGNKAEIEIKDKIATKLYQHFGMVVKHVDLCCFGNYYLFLYVDTKHLSLDKIRKVERCDYYPTESYAAEITLCLCEIFSEFNVPFKDNCPNITVIISDYDVYSVSIYFDVNILKIDEALRKTFSNVNIMVRFTPFSERPYYLIFNNLTEQHKYTADKTVEKMIDFVNKYCKENDPLNIFYGKYILPIITNKEELKKDGQVMGIMRNNPQFTSW